MAEFSQNVIETQGLTKYYKKFPAVQNVSMHVPKGSVYGLIGRNGAGKTTTMKLITGMLEPSEGSFSIMNGPDGRPLRIGTLIEEPGLYPNLTAYENLKIKELAFGGDLSEIPELLSFVGLTFFRDKKVRTFSLGMKQRLGLAMALVGDPEILVLDEPINGLDPQGIADFRKAVKNLNETRGMTVLISSHILEELSKLADVYGIIEGGKLVKEMDEEGLMASMLGRVRYSLSDLEKAREILGEMGIYSTQTVNAHTIDVLEQIGRSGEMTARFVENGITVFESHVIHESLEDWFIDVTKEDSEHAESDLF